MVRLHEFIMPLLLVLLLELSTLTTHVSGQTNRPTRLALPTDFNTTTDHTGQIRSFFEFGGGLSTVPPALICYTNGGFDANMIDPTGAEVVISTRGHPGPAATSSELFISGWAGNLVPNGDAIILHRGPNYFGPDGEYCCRRSADPSDRRCLTLTSCPALTLVTDGTITYNRTTNQATYTCNTGYVLVGTSPITCIEGMPGSWSAAQPTCQLVCPDLTPPANGNPVTYSDNTLPRLTGATATYSCISGYQLTGNTMRSCTASGWDGSDPVCTAICDNLTLTNGVVTYNLISRLEGTVATYRCDAGYTLNGINTRTCQGDMMWSGRAPTCELPLTAVIGVLTVLCIALAIGWIVSCIVLMRRRQTRDKIINTAISTRANQSYLQHDLSEQVYDEVRVPADSGECSKLDRGQGAADNKDNDAPTYNYADHSHLRGNRSQDMPKAMRKQVEIKETDGEFYNAEEHTYTAIDKKKARKKQVD